MSLKVIWCTLLMYLVSGTQAIQRMPRFNFHQSNKVLLTWSDTWEVGTSNMIAILTVGKAIAINISIGGEYEGRLSQILEYECPNDPNQGSIDLNGLGLSSIDRRCEKDLPFTIQQSAHGNGILELKMEAPRISYADLFHKKVKLVVRVAFPTGKLVSNPLFIYNLDPLATYNAPLSKAKQRRFLTNEAFDMITKMNNTQGIQFPMITFIDPVISGLVKNAPVFFKSKLNLGVILYFHPSSCTQYQLGDSRLITSYSSKFDEQHHKMLKLLHMNVQTGTLTFSACGMKNELWEMLNKKKPSTIGICSIVSFTGEVEPYLKIDAIHERYLTSSLSYTSCSSGNRDCEVAANDNTYFTVVSGMDNTAIVCPIICNDMNVPYRFYKDGKPLIGSPSLEWSLDEGVRVSKTGNIIEFPPTVSAAQSGTYRCEAGTKEFSYHVKVVSLPHFNVQQLSSPSDYGLLPEKVFAMEGEALSYSCTVSFASLNSVKVAPAFYMFLTVGDKLNWLRLSNPEFRQKVDIAEEYLTLTTVSGNTTQTLTVSVARVPSPNPSLLTNFSHRFECVASVDLSESKVVGMSSYNIQSGADVVFVPRLTKDSIVTRPENNCSVQKCSVLTGARFEFALTNDAMAYLNSTGVEVKAFFRLGNLLLDDVKVLFEDDASKWKYDGQNSKLTYHLQPIRKKKVIDELVKGKRLTAVFNFRYKSGTNMANLWHNKTAYGKAGPALDRLDCRADPLCFYSTDFDLGRLELADLLSVELAIELAPLPESEAAVSFVHPMVFIAIAVAGALIIAMLAAYRLTRTPERVYKLESEDIKMGHNPRAEAKGEKFQDYVHAGDYANCEDDPPILGVMRSLASTASVNSKDDLELS